MIAEIIFSAVLVYGAAVIYKGGKALFGGGSARGLEGRDGKYHLNGKSYDTIEDYSLALWRNHERQRLEHIVFMRKIGEIEGKMSKDEEELRANVKEWDKQGL